MSYAWQLLQAGDNNTCSFVSNVFRNLKKRKHYKVLQAEFVSTCQPSLDRSVVQQSSFQAFVAHTMESRRVPYDGEKSATSTGWSPNLHKAGFRFPCFDFIQCLENWLHNHEVSVLPSGIITSVKFWTHTTHQYTPRQKRHGLGHESGMWNPTDVPHAPSSATYLWAWFLPTHQLRHKHSTFSPSIPFHGKVFFYTAFT